MNQRAENVCLKVLKRVKENVGKVIRRYGVEEGVSMKKLRFKHKLEIFCVFHTICREFRKEYREPSLSEYENLIWFAGSLCGHSSYYTHKKAKLSSLEIWWTCTEFPHWTKKPRPSPSSRAAFMRDFRKLTNVTLPPKSIVLRTCSSWTKFMQMINQKKTLYCDSDSDCDSQTTVCSVFEQEKPSKTMDDMMRQMEELQITFKAVSASLPRQR